MEELADRAPDHTLARQIHDILKARILNGEIPPGTRLRDNDLAASFRASNTPVREALRLLVRDGLVEIVPYRGCVVRSVDAGELAELLDVRMALEALAAYRAARQVSDEQLRALEDAVQAFEQASAAGDWEQTSEADYRFHRLLAEATGNRTLVHLLQQIDQRAYLARRTHRRVPSTVGEASCRAILEALRSGDSRRAMALAAEHIARCKEQQCREIEEGAP